MILAEGCVAQCCIVQEFVDFDFEIRLFFLPPSDWAPGDAPLRPVRFEYNGWGRPEAHKVDSFKKLCRPKCVARWEGDEKALEAAQERAVEISQFLLAWLRAVHPNPFPMIRLDFMVRRLGPGRAQVVFGEFCEMGACCLAWGDGPPTIR